MSNKLTAAIIAIFVLLFVMTTSLFTVSEGQRAIKLRLGEIVLNKSTGKAQIYNPGLHFKWPFVNTVRKLDVRLHNMSGETSRILTKEQKYVVVEYYAKWRIADIPLYYTRTGGVEQRTNQLLQQKINDELRAAFGKRTIKEVVASDRTNIMEILRKQANDNAASLGINVIDVRIKGIDLPQKVRDSVYKRMSTKREQVAANLRAQGRASAEAIQATADKNVIIQIAEAKAKAQQTRANGDAEAAKIYTNAYTKDPKFYALYRSLQAYREVFTKKKTIMVLRPDSQFFKYFKSIRAKP